MFRISCKWGGVLYDKCTTQIMILGHCAALLQIAQSCEKLRFPDSNIHEGGAARTFACKSQECPWQEWYFCRKLKEIHRFQL